MVCLWAEGHILHVFMDFRMRSLGESRESFSVMN